MSRQLVSSNTPGERLANFSRTVRVGDMVFLSGTTASDEVGATQHPAMPTRKRSTSCARLSPPWKRRARRWPSYARGKRDTALGPLCRQAPAPHLPLSARSREVGAATEMLMTRKAVRHASAAPHGFGCQASGPPVITPRLSPMASLSTRLPFFAACTTIVSTE